MSIKNDLFLSRVLNTELKYQYLKNSPRFQKSDKESVIAARRYLLNNVRSSIYVNTFFYAMISILFGTTITKTASTISTGSFTLFLLLLILAIMTDSQFYRGLWDMKLLTPLTQLPLKLERRVIPLSLFLYNEVYLPFVTIPAGIIISIGLHTPIPLIVYVLFTVLFLYIGRTVSLLLGITFLKTNTNRRTKRLYLGQIFQVLIFVVFILSIQIATNPAFLGYFKVPSLLFLFIPVTPGYISSLNAYPFLVFAITFSLIYAAYYFLQEKNFSDKMETFTDVPSGKSSEQIITRKPVRSLIDKDFKMILRRRGAIMIMVLPVAFIIPIIPTLLSTSSATTGISFSIALLASVFLIDFIFLIGLEGKAAWHLSALPITRREFFFSKMLSLLAVGMIYYAVILVIITVLNRNVVPFLLLNLPLFILILMVVLIAGGTYLVNSIPYEVYSLSQEGIGGRWIFLKTMAIGLPVILVNALLFYFSNYIISYHVPYYLKGYLLTLISDLVISALFVRFFLKKGKYF
jgi:predicted permease